jgi:hypothetical protein
LKAALGGLFITLGIAAISSVVGGIGYLFYRGK